MLTVNPLPAISRAAISLAIGTAALLDPAPAAACGGLFCSSANPVNQAAERIVFGSDGQGNVTAVVEILYEGPSDQFSWVLPVPGEPTIGVSSTVALDRLQQASNPVYQLNTQLADGCAVPMSVGFRGGVDAGAAADGAAGAVTVVAAGTVGPFDFQVISVIDGLTDPADVAVSWLEMNGYDVGDLGRDRLRPYLESGMNLVGFRLTKTAESGSIRPVILEYRSERPMIPIRPTAVAANDDMGVMTWVLGSARAVPLAPYRSLELNEALIDWLNPNDTYNDVVIAAADEAGGHGFVTEQSGPAGDFAETIWAEWEENRWLTLSRQTGSVPDRLTTLTSSFGFHDGFADAVRETVPLRDEATAEEFVECASCYFQQAGIEVSGGTAGDGGAISDSGTSGSDPALATDMAAFIAALERLVIDPMRETAQLFRDHEHVTRLYTTLSADEMTVDPEFDFNPDLDDVSNVHVATRTMSCGGDAGTGWEAELPSGFTVTGEGNTWPVSIGDLPANQRILQLSTAGPGDLLEDNTAAIESYFAGAGTSGGVAPTPGPVEGDPNAGDPLTGLSPSDPTAPGEAMEASSSSDGGGCGCRTAPGSAPSPAGLLPLGLAAAWLARRRRRTAAAYSS